MTQVSIVIPAYNASGTLKRTVGSVVAQTHKSLDIIIVDDGSTDDTLALANQFAAEDNRIRVISQENGGVAKARNTGIDAAQAEWVAPIDADDIWHPRTVERFLKAAQSAPHPVTFVYTWSRRIDEADKVLTDLGQPKFSGDVIPQIVASNFTRNASATMLDRSSVLDVGGYDSGLQKAGAHGAEDIDLYLRLAAKGPVAFAEGYHVGYRQISGSMSQNAHRMRKSVELALNKAEAAGLGLDPRVFKLARVNYALYAAGLSLSSGAWGDLIQYIGKAFGRSPLYTVSYLALVATYLVIGKFASGEMPEFDTLDPDKSHSFPLANLLMSTQNKFHSRLLGTPRPQKT